MLGSPSLKPSIAGPVLILQKEVSGVGPFGCFENLWGLPFSVGEVRYRRGSVLHEECL